MKKQKQMQIELAGRRFILFETKPVTFVRFTRDYDAYVTYDPSTNKWSARIVTDKNVSIRNVSLLMVDRWLRKNIAAVRTKRKFEKLLGGAAIAAGAAALVAGLRGLLR
jgi:hypothetical protein